MLSDTRQEFLFSCALHGLITEDGTERLLGENPMQTVSPNGKHVRENLINQYNADSQHLEHLVVELEAMDGNAATVAQAITEVTLRPLIEAA